MSKNRQKIIKTFVQVHSDNGKARGAVKVSINLRKCFTEGFTVLFCRASSGVWFLLCVQDHEWRRHKRKETKDRQQFSSKIQPKHNVLQTKEGQCARVPAERHGRLNWQFIYMLVLLTTFLSFCKQTSVEKLLIQPAPIINKNFYFILIKSDYTSCSTVFFSKIEIWLPIQSKFDLETNVTVDNDDVW